MKTTQVITVPVGTRVSDLIALFEERNISGAPVVDEHGIMLGVVSKTDIVGRLFRAGTIGLSHAEDVMTPFVFKVTPHDPLEQLLEIMLASRIHRVVVTLDDRPVGMVTTLDLLADYQRLLLPGGAAPDLLRSP